MSVYFIASYDIERPMMTMSLVLYRCWRSTVAKWWSLTTTPERWKGKDEGFTSF